jgi:putative membrane protein
VPKLRDYLRAMDYNIFKSLHIIFVVTWFAGLFYMFRLFVYHAEAEQKDNPERDILLRQYYYLALMCIDFVFWRWSSLSQSWISQYALDAFEVVFYFLSPDVPMERSKVVF